MSRTKESGIEEVARSAIAKRDAPGWGLGWGSKTVRLGEAYLDLVAERDALREALERIEDNAESWHGDNEAKARALTVVALACRAALERRP